MVTPSCQGSANPRQWCAGQRGRSHLFAHLVWGRSRVRWAAGRLCVRRTATGADELCLSWQAVGGGWSGLSPQCLQHVVSVIQATSCWPWMQLV